MDPLISRFPNEQFYSKCLFDDISVSKRDEDEDFQKSLIGIVKAQFGPVKFHDLKDSKELKKDSSKANISEVEFIVQALRDIIQIFNQKVFDGQKFGSSQYFDKMRAEMKGRIGIITPYRG